MKARYGQFHLSDIAQILNELEDSLEKNDWDQLNTKMKRLDQITRTFFIKHRLLVQAANKLLLEEKSAITLKDLKSELNNFSSIQKLKDHINKTYIYQDFKIAFKKYEPLIDELSHEQGKSILLEIRGDEIFVDKDFYSSFIQSSIHIFRNIVDHGIESPEERQKKNKPEMASIVVKTIKKKNNILLIIEDDGRGIDPEKIKSKAIEKGLKSPQEINSMSHRKVLDLIFLPGFSTKNQVNQISGRGVGTDAVRFEVEKLKGTILVESKLGIKTIFTITLPILTEFNS
jgi:two-component system chemotaxis sensor kinase CheA